jgi:hypothetical protein
VSHTALTRAVLIAGKASQFEFRRLFPAKI